MSDRNPMATNNNGVITLQVPRPSVTMISSKFPEGAVFLLCPPEELQPEFIRLPEGKPGDKCPVTGLSRSKMMTLLQAAGRKVKVSYLRDRGKTRGIVLIDRKSLVQYIHEQPRPEWCEGEEGSGGAEE